MADIVSPEVRSRMMAGIGPADTKPEMILRRGLHARGFRYRLHDRRLPGRPDLAFPARKALILVHGCFWHGHDCPLFKWPATRPQFWRDKIGSNIARDARTRKQLLDAGWRVAEVWECTMRGRQRLPLEEVLDRCEAFLRSEERYVSLDTSSTIPVGNPA